MSDIDEAMSEFTNECEEMLERISDSLAKLEKDPGDIEVMNSLYRDVHTIKGSSQLFGFQGIGKLGHAMEATLDPLRKGMVQLKGVTVDLLYQCIDIISKQLGSITEMGEEPNIEADLMDIVPKLVLVAVEGLGDTPHFWNDHSPLDALQTLAKPSIAESPSAGNQAEEPEKRQADLGSDDPVEAADPQIEKSDGSKALMQAKRVPETAGGEASQQDGTPPKPVASPVENAVSSHALVTAKSSRIMSKSQKDASANDSLDTIRVQVGLLDNLMNLTGELVLIRNQVIQIAASQRNREFNNVSQRINVLTSELQAEVMKTRMQPIGNILNKFQRVVRDLAKSLDKNVELEIIGAETELDKTLIEAVKDPLTHIIRNAIDHGIESPEERLKAGKDSVASLVIRSFHEGGQVVIEVSEDGRGLDCEKILQKAIEKNLVDEHTAADLTDRDIHHLIFAPGFSTAEAVTNVSGRGVGMDVVKTNVEEIGGVVDLFSEFGKGSTFKLRIPLTLAIVPALIVSASQKVFAIPQIKLVELIQINQRREGRHEEIEILQGKPVCRLRGQLLPLLSLNEIIGGRRQSLEGVQNIAVLRDGDLTFGLIVDEIQDSSEIVVKPLASFLKGIGIYSGATVMGNGAIALALDVTGIVQQITADIEAVGRSAQEKKSKEAVLEGGEYLVVRLGHDSQYAIALDQVYRLEEFEKKDLHIYGQRTMARYRGKLLPVVDLASFFKLEKQEAIPLRRSVVVVHYEDKMVGMEVQGILDVIRLSKKVDRGLKKKPGLDGHLIYENQTIPLVLCREIVASDEVHLFSVEATDQVRRLEEQNRHRVKKASDFRILCVEDSLFFRKQLVKFLKSKGFNVAVASDGLEGLDYLKSDADQVSLVITDIEMPNMDGFEMVKRIKAHPEWSKIPVIAVTTRFRKSDIERGKALGIDSYLEKLNEAELMANIEKKLELGQSAA